MSLYDLFNPEKYIINSLVKSIKLRKILIDIWIRILNSVLQFHISIIACYLTTINNTNILREIYNFVIPIIITIFLFFISNKISLYISVHKDFNETIVNYFIDNYSKEKLIYWKRVAVIIVFTYILLGIMLIEINNFFILISAIQAIIGFFICDIIEHQMYKRIIYFFRFLKVKYVNNDKVLISSIGEFIIEDMDIKNDYVFLSNNDLSL